MSMRYAVRAGSILAVLLPCIATPSAALDAAFWRDDFDDLNTWTNVTFERTERQTLYGIERENGNAFLLCHAVASASGLITTRRFDVNTSPLLRWRWRVDASNVATIPDAVRGDDYPLRVYVVFDRDTEDATLVERLAATMERALALRKVPFRSLNYVWSGAAAGAPEYPSPYTDRVVILVRRDSSAPIGAWVEEAVDVAADYRRIFKREPPARARIAVMSDADNAGGTAIASMDYIELRPGSL